MKKVAWCILAFIPYFVFVDATELIVNDTDAIKISLFPESKSPLQVLESDKPILRYGFHRTHDCENFTKAFICVRKCLDLDFQIAHSDQDCTCTCYKNTVLSKYKAPLSNSMKWKLGAPTTSKPHWAGGRPESKPDDYEINSNYTEFIEENDKGSADAVEKHSPTVTDTLAEGKSPDERETLAEKERPAQEKSPDEGENPVEKESPAEGKSPDEGKTLAETESPIEGTSPDEGKTPAKTESPAGGKSPDEGKTPAETESPVEKKPSTEEGASPPLSSTLDAPSEKQKTENEK